MMKNINRLLLSKSTVLSTALLLTFSLVRANPTEAPEHVTEVRTTSAIMQQNQKITVKGVVTDSYGPIIAANIMEKGTTNGTITDMNGEFTLTVAANAKLVISYIGYIEQEVPVAGKSIFNILLKEDSQALDEVVVVGYGVQKKVNLSGSVASVNFEEQAMSRPVSNVSSALAGLSAGVQVMQGSGRPGDDGASIRIRGVGTLNSAAPLVLIDGIEGSMDVVNPQDIESISILKDAASASIYGARAANGVILISTKKGQKGKLNVNYSARISRQKPTNLIDLVTNYADYMDWVNEAFTNVGKSMHFNQSTIDLWREKTLKPNELNENGVPNYVAFPNTDWQKAIFGNGVMHDHNVSVSGGADKIRFVLSAGYLENQGLVDNTGIKRYSLRANIEANVTDWLTVGTHTFASQEDKDPGNFDNANNYLRQTTPGVYPEWKGKYGYPEAPEENASANSIIGNLNSLDGWLKKSHFNSTVFSKVKFMKGLTWDFNFNYKRRWDEERTWTNANEKVRFSDGVVMSQAAAPSEMTTSFKNYGNYSYTIQHLLNYHTTIAQHHDIAALVGYEEYYYYEYTNKATKKGLIDQSVNTPGSATEMKEIDGNAKDLASRSYFGRVNYAYKSRYLLEANIRRDGSSRYHKDHRWGTFPSVSAAWRISEESFMEKTNHWLNSLKLRASYGELGNNGGDDVENYEYLSTYGGAKYPIGNILQSGLASTSIANSVLSWEKTAIANIGLDIAVLDNRLTTEIDLYNKNTTGILYRPGIFFTAGDKTAPRMNIAEITNRGIELSVGWKDRINGFSYSISGNFAYNKDKVDKYKDSYIAEWRTDQNGNKYWYTNRGDAFSAVDAVDPVVKGKKMKEFYLRSPYKGSGKGYEADGIHGGPKDGMIRTEQDMAWLQKMISEGYTFMPNKTVSQSKIWYGDYVYADINGDGVYGDDEDRSFQGSSATPKYNFGMQFAAAWKGFDFSMQWAGAAGFKLYWSDQTGYNSPTVRVGFGLSKEMAYKHYFYDPTDPDNPKTNIYAKYGRLKEGESGHQNTHKSSLYLYKGDYLKLKNLTIGYTLPQKVTQKLFTQGIRVYVSGENLLNFNSFPGQDPELGATPKYTSIKQFALGANITF